MECIIIKTMNYNWHYNKLINKAVGRKLPPDVFTHEHHIFPSSLGGPDTENNLVRLTLREHFIAHLLLAKIYGGKMIQALWFMSNQKQFGSRKWSWIQESYIKEVKGKPGKAVSDEAKRKISIANTGRIKSKETIELIKQKRALQVITPESNEKRSLKQRNRKRSPQVCENIRNGRKAKSGWIVSDKTKEKLKESRAKQIRHPHTDETKELMRQKALLRESVMCPYCGKTGSKSAMYRWHFEACKNKGE